MPASGRMRRASTWADSDEGLLHKANQFPSSGDIHLTARSRSLTWPAGGLQASQAILHAGVPDPCGVGCFSPDWGRKMVAQDVSPGYGCPRPLLSLLCL